MSERPLNPKQQRFVQEYLIDRNATQAAIRSGYKQPQVQGPRLLQKVGVATAIAADQQKHAKKAEITLDLLTNMTLDAYRWAQDDGDTKGAVSAVAQLSRMHGFDVSKRINERGPVEDLTAPERDAVRKMVEAALEKARADEKVDA